MANEFDSEILMWQRIATIISAQILEVNSRNEAANRENVEVLREILQELIMLNGRDKKHDETDTAIL